MRKIILASIALLAACGFAAAQSTSIVKSGPYKPLGFCQITSLGSAVSLVTASCATGTVPAGATIAEICVEVASVRYRDDGTAPTTSVGVLVAPASSTIPTCFAYSVKPITNMYLIAVSGSPVVDVSFYSTQ